MSWVFLTDTFAYKLKKPVRYDFLDFSTLALRKHWCEEEVRLNRRLAARTYLGVTPLTRTPSGALRIGGLGQPVDWLVKMRRLAPDRTLEHVIARGDVKSSDISAVARLLAGFYLHAATVALEPREYRERLRAEIEENRRELARYGSMIPQPAVDAITERQLNFLTRHQSDFDRRVEGSHIVEGHGDLRPEHVFLGPPPQIIDCIEFKFDLRVVDPIDELAAFAMECERSGVPEVTAILFETYTQVTKDSPPSGLIGFHKTVRACTRAKLAVWHLKEADVKTPAKWREQARVYFTIASAIPTES